MEVGPCLLSATPSFIRWVWDSLSLLLASFAMGCGSDSFLYPRCLAPAKCLKSSNSCANQLLSPDYYNNDNNK